MFLLRFILYGTLCASWTWLTISFSMLKIFWTVIFSKIFSYSFFFFFFFWGPYNSNVGVFDIVPEVSETILISFHSFYFVLLFRSYFYHYTFQLTICSSALDILMLIPSTVVSISVTLFVSAGLFFNSSRSLWIDYCIFSIFKEFWSRFLIIFTIIILNSFSSCLSISLHLFGLLCF